MKPPVLVRHSVALTILAGFTLVGPSISQVNGQAPLRPARTVTISSTSSCSACSITITQLAAVGDREGPGALDGEASQIAVDGRGRIYVPGVSDAVIRIFDPAGKYMQKVGRRGQGPGEFQSAQGIEFGLHDTMYVYDSRIYRRTTFSPSYQYVSSGRLPPITGAEALRIGNKVVMAGESYTPAGIGFPLHVANSDGSVSRSFGTDIPIADRRLPYAQRRRVAGSPPDRVWSAPWNRYVVEQWDTAGRWLLRIDRPTSWFPPWDRQPGLPREKPPLPTIQGIQEDETGRLWVIIAVADAKWAPRDPQRRPGGGTYMPLGERDLLFDTIIEVIDVRSGALLASHRTPQYMHRFAGPGIVQSAEEDQVGTPRLVLWKLELSQASNRR